MVAISDLKPTLIFDSVLTEEVKAKIKFDIYLNGRKGNPIGHDDFIEFLGLYNIDPSSSEAMLIEAGNEVTLPEGVARFVRTEPSDEEVLALTGTPDLSEFTAIKK